MYFYLLFNQGKCTNRRSTVQRENEGIGMRENVGLMKEKNEVGNNKISN